MDAGIADAAGNAEDAGTDAQTDAGPVETGAAAFQGVVGFLGGSGSSADFAIARLEGANVVVQAEERAAEEMVVAASEGLLILMDTASGHVSIHELREGLPEVTAIDLPGLAGKPVDAALSSDQAELYVAVDSGVGLYAYDLTADPPAVRLFDLSNLHDDGNPNVASILVRDDGRSS